MSTTIICGTLGMSGDYNANSSHQLDLIKSTLSYICEGIETLNIECLSDPIIIADFGSSHGLNSINAMKTIIHYLKQIEKEKQILVIHNDLPTNNWTSLFELLNKEQSYYGVACARSFYESCLPENSLSVGYSSSSLHWLSRKPCNITNHCSSPFAQHDEFQQFKDQAKLDFNAFIQHRARELRSGGILILTIGSTDDQGWTGSDSYNELLYKCAQTLLKPEELINFTIPIYNRSFSECTDHDLFVQCSLKLIKAELHKIKSYLFDQYKNGKITLDEFAKTLTPIMRTWSETILRQAIQSNGRSLEDIENILKQFWILFEKEVRERPNAYEHPICFYNTYLILQKV